MGSGGVSEVPTIFHPRRSRTSNVSLNEDQPTHGLFITPIQVALHTSGKLQQDTDLRADCIPQYQLENATSNLGNGFVAFLNYLQ